MSCRYEVESAVLHYLHDHPSSTLEELVKALPRFTWNQILLAVDEMSRQGNVVLRHPTRFVYLVSTTPESEDRERSVAEPAA